MDSFSKDVELVVDQNRGVYFAPSKEEIFNSLSSLVSTNDYFGSKVPSGNSMRDGAVAFWKLINKSAEWYSLVTSYVALVSNQLSIRHVGSMFIDSMASFFGKSRLAYSDGDIESDVKLRSRIEKSRNSGVDFANSILSLVYENSTVSSCVVYDNFLSQQITTGGVDVDPHSIYLAVDGDDGDEENIAVATAIWKAKSCGCGMTVQKPTLASGLTYRGEAVDQITEGSQLASIGIYGSSAPLVPTYNDVVLCVPKVNTVNRGVLYKWNGYSWTSSGLPSSNVRRVRFQGLGGMPFSAVVNRVSKKKFYVKAYVRRGMFTGTDAQLKSMVKDAVVAWQENEVETVDGLGVGQNAIRYECGNAISHTMPKIKIVDVIFYTRKIGLYGSYGLRCDYTTPRDVGTPDIPPQSRTGQIIKFNSSTNEFSIDYANPRSQAIIPTALQFQSILSSYQDHKALLYSARVKAYTIPAGQAPTPPSNVSFMIYRGVSNNVEKDGAATYYFGYANLQDALNAAKDGEHIYTVADVTLTGVSTMSEDKEVWLDIAGTAGDPAASQMTAHVLTCSPNATNMCCIDVQKGTLHIIDSVNAACDKSKGFVCLDDISTGDVRSLVQASGTGTVVIDGVSFKGGRQKALSAISVKGSGRVVFDYGVVYGVYNGNESGFGHSAIMCHADSSQSNGSSIVVNGGDLWAYSSCICKQQSNCSVTINGGYIHGSNGIYNNTTTPVVVNGGVFECGSSAVFKPVEYKDSNGQWTSSGYAVVYGGSLKGAYIGSNFNVYGNSVLTATADIWSKTSYTALTSYGFTTKSTPTSGSISGGWYTVNMDKGEKLGSSYVTGSQVWDAQRLYYNVGGATWVDESAWLGRRSRQDVGPSVDDKMNVSEARDVYENINVYVYVLDMMAGERNDTTSNDGVSIVYYIGEEARSFMLPTTGSRTQVQDVLVETGETRLCGESEVIGVTGAECAYCATKTTSTGRYDTDDIGVHVQDEQGGYIESVGFSAPAIDTNYVPSANTRIVLSMSFPASNPPVANEQICGFSGRPMANDDSKRYLLYVESVSNGIATFKWAIGNQVTQGVSIAISGQDIEFDLSSTRMKVTASGTTNEVPIIPAAGHDYEVNSIRFMKESEIHAQSTSPVTVKQMTIYEGANVRMNLRPYVTSANVECLKDSVSGVTFR